MIQIDTTNILFVVGGALQVWMILLKSCWRETDWISPSNEKNSKEDMKNIMQEVLQTVTKFNSEFIVVYQ